MLAKKTCIIPTFLILSVLLFTGCTQKELSKKEVEDFRTYISKQTSTEFVDFYEVQKNLNDFLKKTNDKELASEMINDYIFIIYNEVGDYISYFNLVGEELKHIKEELKIDKLDVSMYKDIYKKSKVIGSMLEEMNDKDIIAIDKGDSYTIEVNMDKLLDKYKSYLTPDLVEFMKFRSEEIKNDVYDANSDKFNIDLLLERASFALEKLNSDKDKNQINNWKAATDYYYQVLLAEFTTQFSEGDGETLSKDYISELKSKLEKYKDKQIYKDLSKYIELLEKNDRKINAKEVSEYRTDLLNKILYAGDTKG